MALQIGGMVSGMDTWGLIEQLMEIERRPLVQAQQQQEKLEENIDLFRDIQNRMQRLRVPLPTLRDSDTYLARSAESSDPLVARARPGHEAQPGVHRVAVEQLATATQAGSAAGVGPSLEQAGTLGEPLAQAGLRWPVTGGSFTINNVTLEIDPAEHSLQDVLDMINGLGGHAGVPGVTASYIDDAEEEDYDRLQLVRAGEEPIYLGSPGDSSNFWEATGLLEGTGDHTIVGHRLGGLPADQALKDVGWAQAEPALAPEGTVVINGVGVQWSHDDTLEDIIQRINASGAGVRASFDAASDRLLLEAGDKGNLALSLQDEAGNLLQVFRILDGEGSYQGGALELGQNALFSVNGQGFVRRQNTGLEDVVPGLELDLAGVGEALITVEADSHVAAEGIEILAEEFMDTYRFLRELTARDGDLQGDRTVNRLLQDLRRALTDPVPGAEGQVRSFLDLGLSFSKEGEPSFNAVALENALARDPEAVYRVFSGEGGLADRLEAVSGNYAQPGEGFLSLRQDTLQRRIADKDQRIVNLMRRLEMRESMLVRQFSAMERALAQFEAQSRWLDERLSRLAGDD